MTPLDLQGMPAGAGRKGGRVPRKRNQTTSIPTDENRVPLTPTSSKGSTDSSPDKTGLKDSIACVSTRLSTTGVSNSSSVSMHPSPATYYRQYPLPSSPYLTPFSQAGNSSQSVLHYTQYQSLAPLQSQHKFSSPVSGTSPIPCYHQEFELCFKSGNICAGCRANFTQADVVVVKHYENRTFFHPQSGLPTSNFGNAYTTTVNWRLFDPGSIVIPNDVRCKLSVPFKEIIYQQFGITV